MNIPPMQKGTGEERTDQDIVDQTNKLAHELLKISGFATLNDPNDYHFYKRAVMNPRAKLYWNMACTAQRVLTGTEVKIALENISSQQKKHHF